MSDSPALSSCGFTGFDPARPQSAAAPAVDDSALVHAPASAYVPRASAVPEHRVETPEH